MTLARQKETTHAAHLHLHSIIALRWRFKEAADRPKLAGVNAEIHESRWHVQFIDFMLLCVCCDS